MGDPVFNDAKLLECGTITFERDPPFRVQRMPWAAGDLKACPRCGVRATFTDACEDCRKKDKPRKIKGTPGAGGQDR